MRALTTGQSTFNKELEIETVKGQRKILLNSAVPICDASGAIRGAVGAFQDITERKRLEKALRQAEREAAAQARELEAIFEALTDGLLVYDTQGYILRCNTAARGLFGFEAQPEFALLPWQERASLYGSRDAEGQPVPSEDLVLSRLLRGEVFTSAQAADERLQTPDGREVTVSITGRSLRDARGAISGAVVIARDVTERRRLEQQTRETLKALLAMAEALVQAPDQGSAVGVEAAPERHLAARRLAELTRRVLGCEQVSIVAVESGTEAMRPITLVGLTPEQESAWWSDLEACPHLPERLHPDVVAALETGEPVLLERLQPSLSIWQRLTPGHASLLVPMRIGETLVGLLRVDGSAQGEASVGTNRQALLRAVARLGALVLERERLLREREEARAHVLALAEANRQMEAFVGIVSHELRTPLTSMKLGLQMIQRRLERTTVETPAEECVLTGPLAALTDLLAPAVRQAMRLEQLIKDLLDVSRIREGTLELRLARTDLGALVQEVVAEQQALTPERVIALHAPTGQPLLAQVDSDRVRQAVVNYLTNALKYSPETTPVEVGVEAKAGQACVWVRDQGAGIPLEEQRFLWQRFHRIPGIWEQSGPAGGLGLGLYITRRLIEQQQGQVGVESAPGQGSTFWLTLPLDCQEQA